jgi:Zn-dependent membrane protease YugP
LHPDWPWILIIVGCIFAWSIRYNTYSDLGYFLIILGIIFFAATVLFQLVTLPVEFNASGRALAQMESLGLATDSEIYGAKKVLDAAALTYVAATMSQFFNYSELFFCSADAETDGNKGGTH